MQVLTLIVYGEPRSKMGEYLCVGDAMLEAASVEDYAIEWTYDAIDASYIGRAPLEKHFWRISPHWSAVR